MPTPLPRFNESLGSWEDHLSLLKTKITKQQEEIDHAVEAGKPEAQIEGMRAVLEQLLEAEAKWKAENMATQ